MSTIRPPAVAGLFYPGLQTVLTRNLDELMLRAATRGKRGKLKGLIAPHAGYSYSGYTAATGYKLLKERPFSSVIIVGPSHREYFNGVSIYDGDAFKTPLGDVEVDAGLRDQLVHAWKDIALTDTGHAAEHSVEVQLPFLQRVLGSFSFVPVVMGDQRREYCKRLAEAIGEVCAGKDVLLVASSDLSHYHPYKVAIELDRMVLNQIEHYDPEGLMEKLEAEELEACGGGPVAAVMMAARKLGANSSQILHYCNSGDVSGEKDAVVGYVSAALFQEE